MRANRWNADNSQKCCWFKKIMEENRKGQKNMVWFGRRQNLKTGKFGDTVLIMFAPYRIFQTFWISDLFEKCWPPLSDQFQTFLDLDLFEKCWPPRNNILKGLLRHIYIENG